MQHTTILGIGIDVAGATLAIWIEGDRRSWQVPNTPAGHRQVLQRLRRVAAAHPDATLCVALEATGTLELPVCYALGEAGIALKRLNPKRAKDLRVGLRGHTKTDASDAETLAACARLPIPTWPVPSRAQRDFQEVVSYRRTLVAERRGLRSQLLRTGVPLIATARRQRIAALTREIREVERLLRAHVAADPARQTQVAQLCSIPGVGPVTAWTICARCPPLADCTPKTLASYVGVAPHPQDSGSHRGVRRIRGGDALVRETLYMAALTAQRCNPKLAQITQRMQAAGKPAKVILTACMRKLCTWIIALVKHNTSWQSEVPAMSGA